MRIALMVAAARNGVIGKNNRLPWHLPEDLRYFKRTTMGKPVIMGRKTYASIGRPLPGRANIVISRQLALELPAEVERVHSPEQAIECARQYCLRNGVDEIMVIGGAEVYRQFLPLAERLYLTRVDADVEGDAFFDWQPQHWQLLSEDCHTATADNPYDYRFCVLERITTK